MSQLAFLVSDAQCRALLTPLVQTAFFAKLRFIAVLPISDGRRSIGMPRFHQLDTSDFEV
jgi:hypothetical protein